MGRLSAAPSRPRYAEAVFDTSAWMALLNDEPAARSLEGLRKLGLVTTPIVLAELSVHARFGRTRGDAPVADVEAAARLEPVTREDALEAAAVYARVRKAGRSKVSLAAAMIYATARRIGALLVTADRDLKDEPGTFVLSARPAEGKRR